MVNVRTREFLYNNFPTQADRAKVKLLEVYPDNDRGYIPSHQSSDSGCYHFIDTWLIGEFDVSDFINLKSLLLKGQNQITLKGWERLEKLVNIEIDSCIFPCFNMENFFRLNRQLRQVEREKQELQENFSSLREKIRLDSKEMERLVKNNKKLEEKTQELKLALKEEQKSSTNKQEEINWLKKQLKQSLGSEYETKIEINYPQKFKQ